MILTIVGGGSTFTAGIVKSIMNNREALELTEIRLYDNNKERQDKLAVLVKYVMEEIDPSIKLCVTYDPKEAFENARFIFAQMRVGLYAMREQDEKIPLRHGCVGQETCGAGGLAYGLRTIFPMIQVMDWVEEYAAPDHWILNYSNPAAIMAEACRKLRPNARIINICDMPVAIMENMAAILGVKPEALDVKYFGLNHFGWFTQVKANDVDRTKELIDYIEEHGLINPEAYEIVKGAKKDDNSLWARHLRGSWFKTMTNQKDLIPLCPGMISNTYMQYYLIPQKIVSQSNVEYTRANEVMDSREKSLFEGIDHYVKTGEMKSDVYYAGAHGQFIVDLAVSLKNDLKKKFIVIVENNGTIKNLPDDAMIEVPAYIGSEGPEVITVGEIPTMYKALIEQQLGSEKLLVEGACENSYTKVLQAFILNKTIPSAEVAKEILDEMIIANKDFWPELK